MPGRLSFFLSVLQRRASNRVEDSVQTRLGREQRRSGIHEQTFSTTVCPTALSYTRGPEKKSKGVCTCNADAADAADATAKRSTDDDDGGDGSGCLLVERIFVFAGSEEEERGKG